jgi:hypothetical protein
MWPPSCDDCGVECWIGVEEKTGGRHVRLAGRLSAAQIPELFGACVDVAPLQIDLTELISADVPGVEALQWLRSQGAKLVGAPGYLQLKLDSPTGPGVLPAIQPPPKRER